MIKPTLASLLLSSTLAGCAPRVINVAAPRADTSAQSPPGMSVSGSATLEVSPDTADITMTIDVEAEKPGMATNLALAKQTAIADAMKKVGVAAKEIRLSTVNLGPHYEWDKVDSRNVLQGYRASITITATTTQFDRVPAMLDAGSTNGATSLSAQFRRSDISELKKRVRTMALTAARDKAELSAKALGIELGAVTSVSENQGGWLWTSSYFPTNTTANASGTAEAPVGSDQALGGVGQPLSLNVAVTYDLSQS
ncbi:MAG: SIMPL domain-containing protein [Kofleriaceae bacterium]|nr:SIMPL domain-containing protein [Kofleriaceae bacterium]